AARLVLHLVGEAAAEVLAGAEQRHHVAHVLDAGDDQDLVDARFGELADRVEDHRLAADGQQVLVGDLSEREEPRAGPSREDDALHAILSRPAAAPRLYPENRGKAT